MPSLNQEKKPTRMLHVSGLTKTFGDTIALQDVSFHVEQGEILGLVGPNGSGKSTLLECLCGLLPVERGEVAWDGRSLAPGQRKEVMFYVPDSITPYPEQRAIEVLRFFAQAFCREPAILDEVVAGLGLEPVVMKRVATLSKGFRRRLLTGLGLLAPHPILLLDEPFDGLDVRQTRDVTQLLRATATKARTLFLSIHQLSDAERVCDRFVLLSGGQVRGEGRLDELRARVGAAGGLEDVFLALT